MFDPLVESLRTICGSYEQMMKVYAEGKILSDPTLLDTYLEELNKYIDFVNQNDTVLRLLFDGYIIKIHHVSKEPNNIINTLLWNLSRLDIIYNKSKEHLKYFSEITLDNVLK